MKILVTGSSGFLGKSLVKELKKKHSVKEFDLVFGNNILEKKECEKAAKGIDIIVHMAAVLDEGSALLYKVNVEGTKNILEAGAKARIKQFVFLSTVGVHGKLKKEISEESSIAPETAYEKSKAQAEKLVFESQEMLPITIIRPALVMGANNYWKSIVKFLKKDFPLPGKGNNIFQTVFIDDLVSAIVFLINNPNAMGETFIVAQKEKPSLRQVCELFRKELGLKQECKTMPFWIAKALAYVNLVKNKITGKKSLLEPSYISRLQHERNYSTKKIEGLGWKAKYSTLEAVKKTAKNTGDENEKN